MDDSQIIIVHPNALLRSCMEKAIQARMTSPDSKIGQLQIKNTNIIVSSSLKELGYVRPPGIYIIEDEILNNAQQSLIDAIKKRSDNKIINLLSSRSIYTSVVTELKKGALCYIDEDDDFDIIEISLVKTWKRQIYVSKNRRSKQSGVLSVKLTKRERECCTHILRNVDEVSQILNVNKNSIRTYHERARNKLHLHNHQSLIAWSVMNGVAYIPCGQEEQILGKALYQR